MKIGVISDTHIPSSGEAPPDEVIAAFRAYHEGWIVVQGEGVKALRVNAVLDLRTPDASLHALAEGLPIRVRHVSRYLIVITAA